MPYIDANNKVALITGGARRLGAAICRELHSYGYDVVIHYNTSQLAAEQLTLELNTVRNNSCTVFAADLGNTDQLESLVKHVVDHYGQLDVLINNASAFYPTPVGKITEQQWNELTTINVKAPLFLSQAVAGMLQQAEGCIINILDLYADHPLHRHVVYSASKAALTSITRSLARELAPAIRVNGIAPGAILWPEKTMSEQSKQAILQQVPMQRTGNPADIARTVRFLALESPYITGQIINVDGGRSITV
ncbi:MAG: pteridine reductase [Gammaproteobacteria bacterium]|nr:pteridine reductase [Gammaproteobacteria bacterium]